MLDEILQELHRLNFREAEAQTYLALIRSGVSTAAELARLTTLPRPSVHDALESLAKQGLVTPYVEEGQKRYSAEPPERLLNVLALQRRDLETRERSAERLVPQLSALHTSHPAKPKIRYMEGVDGLRNMRREYECLQGDILQIVGYDAYQAFDDRREAHEHRSVLQQTSTRRIRALLVTDRVVEAPLPGIEIRCLPMSVFPIAGEVTVCGDRVAIFSFVSGVIAIEIRSSTIADVFRTTLELAWRGAEPLSAEYRATRPLSEKGN